MAENGPHALIGGARRTVARGATTLGIAIAGAFASTADPARSDDTVDQPPASVASAAATGSTPTAGGAAAPSGSATAPWAGKAAGDTREGLDPFPSIGQYLSYGFAFHSESLLAPGNVCPKGAAEQCILAGGGGISFSGAYRTPGYSLGAVYEASFHDSHNIYQRGVLQQLRGEWRLRPKAWAVGESINGLVGAGAGVATYGDNWTIATVGGAGHGFFGAEWDLGVKLSMSFVVSYRAIYFREFTDPTGQHRPAGLAHLLGLQLGLELHEPL
ncbi:MAG: hypothetical protein HYV09_25435 [Deltaproteobacteria bacterium]|nr:hypothetical protein [Deltaproteobacteria bacterium]